MHEVETMFTNRKLPWHYEETKERVAIMPGTLTAADALRWSGLDWEVEKLDVYADFNPAGPDNHDAVPLILAVPGYKVIARETDGQVYGVVSDRYEIINNREVIEFVEALLDDPDVQYETAGSLKKGARIWVLVRLGPDIVIGTDPISPYFLVTSSHDASQALMGMPTPVRVECANTERMAVRGAKAMWSMKHTSSVQGKIAEAKSVLGITYNYYEGFAAEVTALMEQEIPEPVFEAINGASFPIVEDDTDRAKAGAERRRETVRSLYWESPGIKPFIGTGWGIFNAFNEWEQWSTRAVSPTSKGMASFPDRYMARNLRNDFPISAAVGKALVSIR